MPGIYPMAALTVLVTSLLVGGLVYVMSGRQFRYLPLALLAIPLSTIGNLLVKAPLGIGVGWLAGIPSGMGLATPLWFLLFLFMLSPVCEEAIKLAPLALYRRRTFLSRPLDALWAGMALGLGFGLGEAAYLAWGIAQDPQYAGIPWYQFGGYGGERLLVTLFHGIMTAVVTAGLQRGGRWGVLGYLGGMGLHALVNAGAMLYQLGLVPIWAANVGMVVSLIVGVLVFERLRRRALRGPGGTELAEEVVYFKR